MVRVATRRKICNELRTSLSRLKIGESEVGELYSQLKSSINNILADHPSEEEQEDLGNRAKFLARLMPLYSHELSDFPHHIKQILYTKAHIIPSNLRINLTKLLIFFQKRKIVDLLWNLALFIKLQTLGDRVLKDLAFSHVIEGTRKVKVRRSSKIVELQNILFSMMQEEDEAQARRSLAISIHLYKKGVLFNDRTFNAICNACFHPSSWVMYTALFFLLRYDEMSIENDDSEDDQPIHKAHHSGASSSESKKQEKLLWEIRCMKVKRPSSLLNKLDGFEDEVFEDEVFSEFVRLEDAQGFIEKLFCHLKDRNERFEIKLMMMEVISRAVRTQSLLLVDLYPYFQEYVQPTQHHIAFLLEAVVRTCHEKVPPKPVKPLLEQIMKRFVLYGSCSEDILLGLEVVRRICMEMPLLITDDLIKHLHLLLDLEKSDMTTVERAADDLIESLEGRRPSLDDGSEEKDDEKSEQYLVACNISVGEKDKKVPKRKVTDFEGSLMSVIQAPQLQRDRQNRLVVRGSSSGKKKHRKLPIFKD